jgi:uncharacterized membrane protein YidH (DUF202 family)
MGKYPLETGNFVLILLGILLVCLGPYIVFRTVKDIRARQARKESIALQQWGSHALNFLIAALFLFAGTLFVINNLRGNPLH